jgi:hypothetical protein
MGAAIMFPDGRVAGALSIAAIDSRMTAARQPELAHRMKSEVERIEGKLRKMFVSSSAPGRAASHAAAPIPERTIRSATSLSCEAASHPHRRGS